LKVENCAKAINLIKVAKKINPTVNREQSTVNSQINLIKVAKKINLVKIAFIGYNCESPVDSSLTER
jgi:hypothetical protein